MARCHGEGQLLIDAQPWEGGPLCKCLNSTGHVLQAVFSWRVDQLGPGQRL